MASIGTGTEIKLTVKETQKKWPRKAPRIPDRRSRQAQSPESPSLKEPRNEQVEQLTVSFGQCLVIRSRSAQPPHDLSMTIDEIADDFDYAKITIRAPYCWSVRKSSPTDALERGGLAVLGRVGEVQNIGVDHEKWSLSDVLFVHILDRGNLNTELRLCFSNRRQSYVVPRGKKKHE